MRPRFSVVLTVRNRSDVIGRAVAGVLAQTFAELELVVVDDGSDDDTVELARCVSDERVRMLRQEPSGEVAALRRGLRAANGRFVAVLGPDDEVAPGWLARLGQLLDTSGAALAGCGGEQRHPDGSRTTIGAGTARPGSFVVRRDLLGGVGAFEPPAGPATLSDVHECVRARVDLLGLGSIWTPEPLVQWNDPPTDPTADEPDRLGAPAGELAQLAATHQALDAQARTPIPDPDMLVRCATLGGVAAVRLGDHREARRLFALARSVRPDVWRHWARWAVALVPPVASRVWSAPAGEPTDERSSVEENPAKVPAASR